MAGAGRQAPQGAGMTDAPRAPGTPGTTVAPVAPIAASTEAGSDATSAGSDATSAGSDATSAGTGAGTVSGRIAMGAPGAVSTSSATLYSHASVYRQCDLEAIPGLAPRIGAVLRDHGIDSFAKLAALPPAELARLVDGSGDEPSSVDTAHWPELATLAAGHDWAGFAALAERAALRLLRGSRDQAESADGGGAPGVGTAT